MEAAGKAVLGVLREASCDVGIEARSRPGAPRVLVGWGRGPGYPLPYSLSALCFPHVLCPHLSWASVWLRARTVLLTRGLSGLTDTWQRECSARTSRRGRASLEHQLLLLEGFQGMLKCLPGSSGHKLSTWPGPNTRGAPLTSWGVPSPWL